MSLLESNLALLRGRYPELAALLDGIQAAELEAFPARSGEPCARLGPGGALLHSSYDPRREAERLAAGVLGPETDTALVLGLGLGYLAEAAFAAGVEKVVVAEAEPSLLKAALAIRPLDGLLSREGLVFVVGGGAGGLLAAFESLGSRRVGRLALSASLATAPDWYAGAESAFERFLAKESINENTLKRFGGLWVRNLAANSGGLGRLPGVARLDGRFAGLPALLLAAGPSLDELLPLLPELRERCLLVAVDTALRSLLRVGIEPDFLVVVDPQYWNWRHLAGLAAPKAFLVTETAAYPPVLRFPSRGTFLASSLYPLGKALEAGREPLGELGAGGSVATTAWDLCRLFGSSPVYLGGLDLGYPGARTHARASLFEQRALATGRRQRTAESHQAGALFGAPVRELRANDGGALRSDERMRLYAWWFESRLARPGSPASLSLSASGVAIPGMGFAEPASLLDLAPARAELEARLAALEALAPAPGSAEAAALACAARGARQGLLRELGALSALAERGRSLAERALRAAEGGSGEPAGGLGGGAAGGLPALLGELDSLDAELLRSSGREVAGFLLPPLGELLGGRPRNLAESLRASLGIYRRLGEACALHLRLLEEG